MFYFFKTCNIGKCCWFIAFVCFRIKEMAIKALSSFKVNSLSFFASHTHILFLVIERFINRACFVRMTSCIAVVLNLIFHVWESFIRSWTSIIQRLQHCDIGESGNFIAFFFFFVIMIARDAGVCFEIQSIIIMAFCAFLTGFIEVWVTCDTLNINDILWVKLLDFSFEAL